MLNETEAARYDSLRAYIAEIIGQIAQKELPVFYARMTGLPLSCILFAKNLEYQFLMICVLWDLTIWTNSIICMAEIK